MFYFICLLVTCEFKGYLKHYDSFFLFEPIDMFIAASVLIFTKKTIFTPNLKNLYVVVFVNSLRVCFSFQMFLMLNSYQKVIFFMSN
jgi:hypothetical protein